MRTRLPLSSLSLSTMVLGVKSNLVPPQAQVSQGVKLYCLTTQLTLSLLPPRLPFLCMSHTAATKCSLASGSMYLLFCLPRMLTATHSGVLIR